MATDFVNLSHPRQPHEKMGMLFLPETPSQRSKHSVQRSSMFLLCKGYLKCLQVTQASDLLLLDVVLLVHEVGRGLQKQPASKAKVSQKQGPPSWTEARKFLDRRVGKKKLTEPTNINITLKATCEGHQTKICECHTNFNMPLFTYETLSKPKDE